MVKVNHHERSMFARYESKERSMHSRFGNELPVQSSNRLHKSGLLRVIYAILNASVILERNETRLARNETRLVTNEARGGKLPLSGTVLEIQMQTT